MPLPVSALPSADILRETFFYDPDTGFLARRSDLTRHAGSLSVLGYWCVRVGGRKIRKAHRVIWKMVTGEEPPEQVDHANGNRSDNRWVNLRAADNSLNQANRRKAKGSVLKGVRKSTGCESRWHAGITVRGVSYHLGSFETEAAAHAAYQEAAKLHFGEYARAA